VYGPVTDIVETFTKYLGVLLASFPYEPEEELTKEAESAFMARRQISIPDHLAITRTISGEAHTTREAGVASQRWTGVRVIADSMGSDAA